MKHVFTFAAISSLSLSVAGIFTIILVTTPAPAQQPQPDALLQQTQQELQNCVLNLGAVANDQITEKRRTMQMQQTLTTVAENADYWKKYAQGVEEQLNAKK